MLFSAFANIIFRLIGISGLTPSILKCKSFFFTPKFGRIFYSNTSLFQNQGGENFSLSPLTLSPLSYERDIYIYIYIYINIYIIIYIII